MAVQSIILRYVYIFDADTEYERRKLVGEIKEIVEQLSTMGFEESYSLASIASTSSLNIQTILEKVTQNGKY